jgi:hypothetical protein
MRSLLSLAVVFEGDNFKVLESIIRIISKSEYNFEQRRYFPAVFALANFNLGLDPACLQMQSFFQLLLENFFTIDASVKQLSFALIRNMLLKASPVNRNFQSLSLEEYLKESSFTSIDMHGKESGCFLHELWPNYIGWIPCKNIKLASTYPVNKISPYSRLIAESGICIKFPEFVKCLIDQVSKATDHDEKDAEAAPDAWIFSLMNYEGFLGIPQILGALSHFSVEFMHAMLNYTLALEIDSFKDEDEMASVNVQILQICLEMLSDPYDELLGENLAKLQELIMKIIDSCSLKVVDLFSVSIEELCSYIDPRRIDWFIQFFFNSVLTVENFNSFSETTQLRRLKVARAMERGLSWRSGFVNCALIKFISAHFESLFYSVHEQVRNYSASILRGLCRNAIRVDENISFLPFSNLLDDFIMEKIVKPLNNFDFSSDHGDKKISFILEYLKYSDAWRIQTRYVILCLGPIAFSMGSSDRHTVSLAKTILEDLSQVSLSPENISLLIEQCSKIASCRSLKAKSSFLSCISRILRNQNLHILKAHFDFLFNFILDFTTSEQIDIRKVALQELSKVLAKLPKEVPKYIKSFLRSAKSKESLKGISGLCAAVYSESWDVPDWMPKVLSFLSENSFSKGYIGIMCRKTIEDFRISRKDQMHKFESRFTEEELDSIRSIQVGHSYFA